MTNTANIKDPRLVFANPAGIGFYDYPFFVAARQNLYTGINGDKLSDVLFGAVFPFQNIGALSLSGQYFNAHIQNRINLDFSYAKSFDKNRFSMGINLGLLGYTYNRNNFNLIDINDPLLAKSSVYDFNVGAGVIFTPIQDFYIGLGMNHINRPDLSLEGNKSIKSRLTHVSARYRYKFFCPMAQWYTEDNFNYYKAGAEVWLLNDQSLMSAFYSSEQLSFGLGVVYKNLRIDYFYDYQLSDLNKVSSGSHHFVFSYSPMFQKDNFKILINPTNPVDPINDGIYPTQNAEFTISVDPSKNLSKPVELILKNSSKNINLIVNKNQLGVGESAELSVQPLETCVPGLYKFKLKGKAGNKCHGQTIKCCVKPFPKLVPSIICQKDTVTILETKKIIEETSISGVIFFDPDSFQLDKNRFEILNPTKSSKFHFIFYPDQLYSVSSQYKNMLNLIGWRLKQNPDLKIKIVGFKNKNKRLYNDISFKRVQSVRDYFIKNLLIHDEQITADSYEIYEASVSNNSLDVIENQRVVIIPYKNSEDVLKPIAVTRSIKKMSDSLCIFDISNSYSGAGVKNWEVKIRNKNDNINTLNGENKINELVRWNWLDKYSNSGAFPPCINYQLSMTDSIGQRQVSEKKTIKIGDVSGEQEKIEIIRICFFEFDEDEINITPGLEKRLTKLEEKLTENMNLKITVRGFTDFIGSKNYNKNLSVRRAKSAIDKLEEIGIPKSRISYKSLGEAEPLMDNNLPEGRMMNRRVEIILSK